MATEITLLGTFLMALVILRISWKRFEPALSARIGMAAMLTLTGIAHFFFTKGMVMMLPAFVPMKTMIIYLTGVLELIAAIGLLMPKYQVRTAWGLIVFLILLLPANVYAAVQHVNLEAATYDGAGPQYLWYRIPLQILFIAWVHFSAVSGPAGTYRKPRPASLGREIRATRVN
jgi:uncharacterized membrane protein